MENLIISVNAVVPFLIYILLGAVAVKAQIADETFLRRLNAVAFRVFFPFMMFNNIYNMDISAIKGGYIIFGAGSLIALIVLLMIFVPVFVKGNPQRGVMVQAIYRSNSVIFAIPLAASVLGEEAAGMASMLVAVLVPIYNISAVIILEYYRGKSASLGKLLVNILKNPLIIGAIFGIGFALTPFTMPVCLSKPIGALGSLCTPLAMFVLGGTLHLSAIRKNLKYLVPGLALKLVIVPLIVLLIMKPFNFSAAQIFAMFCMFATPVATSSYPMAASMDADGELAGQFVVISTVLSIITLFLWIYVLKTFGVI